MNRRGFLKSALAAAAGAGLVITARPVRAAPVTWRESPNAPVLVGERGREVVAVVDLFALRPGTDAALAPHWTSTDIETWDADG